MTSIGLAIAICGPFDLDAGESRMRGVAKFEDIYGIDLRAALRERTTIGDRPIRFTRDAESAGTGEALAGAGKGVDRVMTITLGTGMGTCVTDHAWPVEFIDGFGVEHLGMRATPWDGRSDDVLSARGLADRLERADSRPAGRRRRSRSTPRWCSTTVTASASSWHPSSPNSTCSSSSSEAGCRPRSIASGPAIESHLDVPVRPIALGAAGPILGAAHLAFS